MAANPPPQANIQLNNLSPNSTAQGQGSSQAHHPIATGAGNSTGTGQSGGGQPRGGQSGGGQSGGGQSGGGQSGGGQSGGGQSGGGQSGGDQSTTPPSRPYSLLLDTGKFLKRTLVNKVFGTLLGIVAIALTLITIFPAFSSKTSGDESLELAKWTAAKDFKEACRDEKVSVCIGLYC
jgi:hypothetical protein